MQTQDRKDKEKAPAVLIKIDKNLTDEELDKALDQALDAILGPDEEEESKKEN